MLCHSWPSNTNGVKPRLQMFREQKLVSTLKWSPLPHCLLEALPKDIDSVVSYLTKLGHLSCCSSTYRSIPSYACCFIILVISHPTHAVLTACYIENKRHFKINKKSDVLIVTSRDVYNIPKLKIISLQQNVNIRQLSLRGCLT